MVIFITPALEGLRPEWDEAARNLGATRFQYLRLVVVPGARAVGDRRDADAVRQRLLRLRHRAGARRRHARRSSPAGSTSRCHNNVLPAQNQIAMALGTEMIVVVLIVMVGLLVRAAARREVAAMSSVELAAPVGVDFAHRTGARAPVARARRRAAPKAWRVVDPRPRRRSSTWCRCCRASSSA